jgi:hypothetical protein
VPRKLPAGKPIPPGLARAQKKLAEERFYRHLDRLPPGELSDMAFRVPWIRRVLDELGKAYGVLSERTLQCILLSAKLQEDAKLVREHPEMAKALAVSGKLCEQSAGLLRLATQFAAEDKKNAAPQLPAKRDPNDWMGK